MTPPPPPYLKVWIQHCFVPNLLNILLCSCLEMVTVASSPRPSSAAEVETDTEYLKTARKGGGHKGWLKYEIRIDLYTMHMLKGCPVAVEPSNNAKTRDWIKYCCFAILRVRSGLGW